MARTRPSWVLPCKNAARMSKLLSVHPMELINWSRSILDCFPNVGLSLGTVSFGDLDNQELRDEPSVCA